jgi:uncharacterized protein YfkK (UPF0435 family)
MPDLTVPSEANIAFMVEEIRKRLNMATAGVMRPELFPLERYGDLFDIYEWVVSKSAFSISEMEAVAAELGKLTRR